MTKNRFDNNTRLLISVSNNPTNFGVTIYNYLFDKLNMNYIYLPFNSVHAEGIASSIKTLSLYGCSVSSPLKSEMFKLVDIVDEAALSLGNINTKKNKNGILTGYNTDYYGFKKVAQKVDLSNPLIYGYGSVTNTIVSCLKDLNCNNISLTGRDKEKAKKFIKKHNLQKLNSNQKYSVLINATPSTTKEEEVFNILSYCDSLIDLNVTKNLNDLVLEAKKNNKLFIPGSDMSIYQLQKQFEIYFSQSLDTELLMSSLDLFFENQS